MLGNAKPRRMDARTTDTLIGESTIFEGKIVSEASLRIEGQLVGDIECTGDVTVGENAILQSNIQGQDVIIAGKVRGNVQTKGKLVVTSSGLLVGNIEVRSFVIEEGGVFQGMSIMSPAAAGSERGSGGKVYDAKAHKQQKSEQQAVSGG